ncbi:hypothetical protein Tco_1255442 [Tanacetum coccineum]
MSTTFFTLGGKDLVERGDRGCLDVKQVDICPSFIVRPLPPKWCFGWPSRVGENDLLKPRRDRPSIRRGGAKDSITIQTCELSKEEFNDFLTLYPIPFEYRVILPKSNQTVFDAPPGFIYQGSIVLVVPSSPLLLSCAKLMVVSPLSTASEGFSICVELCLGRYPTSVRVFPDPIPFLAGLKPSWEYVQQWPAIMADDKDDEDLSFLPKEPSLGFGTGSPSVSINMEPLKANKEPVIQPEKIKDRKCKTRGGSSRPPVKRKLTPESSTSRATHAKTSSSKDDAPFLTVSDNDEGLPDVLELKDATACHLKISTITPLA